MEPEGARIASEYMDAVNRHQPTARGQARRPRIRFADFRQIVRRFRPSNLLPVLASLATSQEGPPFSIQVLRTAPPWAIATAARESIIWGNEYRNAHVTSDDLRTIFNAHNNVDDVAGNDSVHSLLTRIAYEQFPYQESVFEEVSRTHALLVDGIGSIDAEVLGDDAWNRLLGAPLGQVVGATFFLHVAASQNAGWVDRSWLDRPGLEPLYNMWPRQVVDDRLDQLTSTFREFREAYESVPHPPAGAERYAFNPLTARPFVRMPDGRLLAPQPNLILRTASPGGLYYPGIAEFGEAFGRDLGRLAERYVGEQLSSLGTGVELYPEIRYGRPEKKSIDWFLVLPSAVIMFEVKSARFGLLERAGVQGFEVRAQELLNKALRQLGRTNDALDSANTAFSHIPPDRQRVGVIVTAEPHYLANSPWMRENLNRAPFPTIVASLRDVEHLCCLPLDGIEKQLVEIANDAERSTWNLGNALKDVPEEARNTVLDAAWEAYPWPEDPDESS